MSDACNVLIPSAYEDIVSVVGGIKRDDIANYLWRSSDARVKGVKGC